MSILFLQLYRGCCDTADVIAGWDPELIILHSPHGITLQKSTGIYFGSKAVGTAEWNDNWGEYAVMFSYFPCNFLDFQFSNMSRDP